MESGQTQEINFKKKLPLEKHLLVGFGKFLVDSHEIVSIPTSACAATAGLNPENVIENGADEIVMKESATGMSNHEREYRQSLDVL